MRPNHKNYRKEKKLLENKPIGHCYDRKADLAIRFFTVSNLVKIFNKSRNFQAGSKNVVRRTLEYAGCPHQAT